MISQTFSHYKVRERCKAMNTQNVVMILLVLTTSLQAQVIPGRWEKVDSLPAHAWLTITLKSGTKENYIFKIQIERISQFRAQVAQNLSFQRLM